MREERLAQQNAEHCETEKSAKIQEGGTDSTHKILSLEENAMVLSHKLAPKTIGLCPLNLIL